MSKMVEVTYYPFSDTIKQYVIRYIHDPIMVPLTKLYRSSPLIEKLARKTSEQNNAPTYDELLKSMRGVSLLDRAMLPEEYKLTHHFADGIDDKLNTIIFVEQEITSDLRAISDHIKSHGYERIDLGDLHWELLIDVECLLLFCRSILDIFARLTRILYKQMCSMELPDGFTDQVSKYEKYLPVDEEYFSHISQFDWFPKLKDYRDDLSHKTSLNIIVEPGSEPYLRTTRNTRISFADIGTITSGVRTFAAYYVEHFSRVLEGLSNNKGK